MPGYPRMDVGNPYVTARYDSYIVDSLPWGRGWLADGSQVGSNRQQQQQLGLSHACALIGTWHWAGRAVQSVAPAIIPCWL